MHEYERYNSVVLLSDATFKQDITTKETEV